MMPAFRPLLLGAVCGLLLLSPVAASGGSAQRQLRNSAAADTAAKANPIRKVVTLLQNMQAQVTEEGVKEQKAYDEFMCYCKTGVTDLEKEIEAGKGKITSTTAALAAAKEKKAQTEVSLKEHQTSRAEAKEAMAQATAIRAKEAAAFAKEKAEYDTNIGALGKAISTISKGVFGSFLQSGAAETLRRYFMYQANVNDSTRQEMLSFLSGSQAEGYVPQSGEIIGILKQMDGDMKADLKEATDAETSLIQSYEQLMAAKTKEVNTLTGQIEHEMMRIGDLGVEISMMGIDLEDTKDGLADNQKYLAELGMSCETKTKEWEEIKKTRAEELLALAETIKVLNDDDALELFKKTLPSAGSSSFAQVELREDDVRAKALRIVRGASGKIRPGQARPELDLVALALRGKAVGFAKVIKMIDEMVANLKEEQVDDDLKKEYCDAALDKSEDKKKALELSQKDSETAIEDLTGSIAMLKDEIETLEDGIKALDKSVAEATDMRKSQHEEYSDLMMNDANAKEVLLWAKNRLNKFYSPKLYKAPPKRALTEAEDTTLAFGGTLAPTSPPGGIAGTGIGLVQLGSAKHHRAAPPPPPETFGAYKTKSEENTGVLSMIDLLIKDLDKEMQASDVEEKDAQKDYEATMAAASSKRAEDSKAVTEKTAAKAAAEESLQAEKDKLKGTKTELMQTGEFIASLHGECDWLLKYFDVRKEARSEEMDALSNAKAVLSGADYSLLQQDANAPAKGFLRATQRH